ncbi:hypothetical protein [Taibaiella koreensis]|uniref:hypothetical protein n=1 Tax=Taibaiella koreensis TaxID=1268548 RepID=UPI000E59E179|nr:hypothetical protein [Taibaiella koreensis]
MKTEEYIIILVGVTADDKEVTIVYSSDSRNEVSVKVSYSSGKTVKTFEHIAPAEQGVLTFPSSGLMPGTYTCAIYENGTERDSRSFNIR